MADTRTMALRAMKTLAAAGDRVRPPTPGVVVLIYHRVGGVSGTEIDLPAEAFDEQMAWLAASGRVVTLDEAVDRLAAGDERPATDGEDPVVVTFDDGTADLADVATPILERHGVPATVYLATRYVDEGVAVPRRRHAPVVGRGARHGRHRAGDVRVAHPRAPPARPPAAGRGRPTSSTGRRP